MIAYGRFHFHSLSNTPRSPTYDFRPMGPLVQVLDAETSKDVLVCDALDEAGWWWWWWLYMIKWLLSWFNRYYLIFVPVQFKLKPKKTLVIPCPIYIHTYIYIHNILSNSPSVAGDAPNQLVFQWEPLPGFLLSTGLWLGNSGDTIATATNEWWNRVAYIWPDGTRWTCSLKGNMKFDLRNKCICHFA